MREDTTRTRVPASDGADDDAPPSDSLFGDLSGAAREAVHSPADPRLDAHLARLGLADDPTPAALAKDGPGAAEVDRLRASVAAQETAVAELRDKVRQLTLLAAAGLGVGIVALIIALIR